jgi:hypothetical protein
VQADGDRYEEILDALYEQLPSSILTIVKYREYMPPRSMWSVTGSRRLENTVRAHIFRVDVCLIYTPMDGTVHLT